MDSARLSSGDEVFSDGQGFNEASVLKSLPEYNAPKVIVAIPAYNEEIAIGSIVLRTVKYADEVIVIDDGSDDHTAEVSRLAGARVVTHAKNEGKGAGVRDAFSYAKDNHADILVLMDGDGQHDPDEIPELIKPILERKADFVNGSRVKAKFGSNAPMYRRFGQRVLDKATNAGCGRNITDTQSGFRAFSRRTFGCFSFMQNGMAVESEMLMDAAEAGLKIKEVPINVRYDVEGSTYNPLVHGASVLGSVIGEVLWRRPVLSFCMPGACLAGIGMISAFLLFNTTHGLAVEYAIIALISTGAGAIVVTKGIKLSTAQAKNKQKNGRRGDGK